VIAGRRSTVTALTEALAVAMVLPEDAATVALAQQYAAALDEDPEALAKVGPLFLACLVELRMTPKARAALAKPPGGGGADVSGGETPLQKLRREKDLRAAGAAAVDSTPA